MARPLRIQFPGALYHLTNRGNERKGIFRDDEDRATFLDLLQQSLDTYSVILHSFVLMKNHWHFLAQTPLGNLSEFMRHFNISYTSHFNRRHKRSGHLYQGRYKSILVEQDSYLDTVSRYIHLNPVNVHGLKTAPLDTRMDHLASYRWSSLPGYIGAGKQLSFVTCKVVLAPYGTTAKSRRQRYRQQIALDLQERLEIKDKVIGQTLLGSAEFVARVQADHLDTSKDRERPAYKKIQSYLLRDTVLEHVEQALDVSPTAASGINRAIVMTLLYNYAGLTNQQIGNLFNCDYSTVSQSRRRLRLKLGKDKTLKARVASIEDKLSKIKI